MVEYFEFDGRVKDCLDCGSEDSWDEQVHTLQVVHNERIVQFDGKKTYLGYYCNPRNSSVGLAYSSNLKNWTRHPDNPILQADKGQVYRWPSVCFYKDTFIMFLSDTKSRSLERWTSTDGLHFDYQETVAEGTQFFNPFVWQDPNSEFWHLYCHIGSGTESEINVMTARSPYDFSSDSMECVVTCPDGWMNIAAPTVMYSDERYWLAVEYKEKGRRWLPSFGVLPDIVQTLPGVVDLMNGLRAGDIWKIATYYSDNPIQGYQLTSDSPILTSVEACPIHLKTLDDRIFLYYNQYRQGWTQNVISLVNASLNTTSEPRA